MISCAWNILCAKTKLIVYSPSVLYNFLCMLLFNYYCCYFSWSLISLFIPVWGHPLYSFYQWVLFSMERGKWIVYMNDMWCFCNSSSLICCSFLIISLFMTHIFIDLYCNSGSFLFFISFFFYHPDFSHSWRNAFHWARHLCCWVSCHQKYETSKGPFPNVWWSRWWGNPGHFFTLMV